MGPLITQGIIAAEWHYLIALVLGILFGMVLEQAGFSTSRKLVGLFYGYDFTVLRVFFTAAITAMVGLMFFSYFGWIDLKLIYVNPLFTWSTIVGGIIMGIGFIVGGFCPGTSMCALGIGKLDALAFIIGITIGTLIFGETYSVFKSLHQGHNLGGLKVYDALGISAGLFAFLLIVIALVAFFITAKIQDKVKKVDY